MCKISIYKIRLVVLLMLTGCCLQAQKKSSRKARNNDTLADIRNFIRVSNIYQQQPLYLDMEWKNSTNFITSYADTSGMRLVFYLKPGMAYIRFDEAEQLVNDSMALLVSDKLQRMILYSNAQPVIQKMKSIITMLTGDSSVQQMAVRYKAESTTAINNLATTKLTGREYVQGSSLPKESIELQYDVQKNEPIKVITTRRSLVRIPEQDYKDFSANAQYKDMLVAIEGKGHFLVKEQTSAFIYNSIKHEADMKLPVTIADRLTRNELGELVPVKQYEQYAVTYN
jgi:hypothetical protein